MRLILVRHALPRHGDDPGLTDEGRQQVAALIRALAGLRIDAVWSSPMVRAVETAQPLADAIGLPVRLHDGLREMAFDGPYVPLEEAEHPIVLAFHERLRSQADDPAFEQFRSRVLQTFGEIAGVHAEDSTVAAVCHGGVISAYASAALGIADVIFFVAAYTGFSRFDVGPDGTPDMVSLNEHGHLGALDALTAG